MRLRDFIKQNRPELHRLIRGAVGSVPRTASCDCPLSGTDHRHEWSGKLDDERLAFWIMNDEGLYRWARSEGVRI